MFPLHGNFTLCISGASRSGKSSLVIQMLLNRHQMFDTKFTKINWILGDENAIPRDLNVPIEYNIGLPASFENKSLEPRLYIIDDSMEEIVRSKSVLDLLCKHSHHMNISVIVIFQNIFHAGKYSRDISLNFTHLCIFNSPRYNKAYKKGLKQVKNLSSLLLCISFFQQRSGTIQLSCQANLCKQPQRFNSRI